MTIDTSGRWWTGSAPEDTEEYLRALGAGGHAVDATRPCRCDCGGQVFRLEADPREGVARRTCTACGAARFIADGAELAEDAVLEPWACTECGEETCNLGVGFSLYAAQGDAPRDVRWISVGQRCTGCGTLGSVVDWKVGYGPSDHLLDGA